MVFKAYMPPEVSKLVATYAAAIDRFHWPAASAAASERL